MRDDTPDVLLVTTDAELSRHADATRPCKARLRCVAPESFAGAESPRAGEYWIDLDSIADADARLRTASLLAELPRRRCVYFSRGVVRAAAPFPPGDHLRMPCGTVAWSVLWAAVPTNAPTTDGVVPLRLCQALSVLETRGVIDAVLRDARAAAGYEHASLYVLDAAGRSLNLAATTRLDPVELAISRGSGHVVAAALATPGCVECDDLARYCRLRGLTAGSYATEAPAAVLALRDGEDVVGTLLLLGRSASASTVALSRVAPLIARALHNAQRYERAHGESRVDGLTGLHNYRGGVESLAGEIERCRRYGRALSLVVIDVDGLKQVNDAHGHAAGNAVLRHVAGKIRAQLRQVDSAARMGGDEFAIVLPATDRAGALHVAERIRAALTDDPATVGDGRVVLTASFGVAEWLPGASAEGLLSLADAALYDAKRAGRDRVCTA